MGNTNLDHKAIPKTCSACGRVGHRSAGCTRSPAPHDKIGIEIEGGWDDLATAKDTALAVTGKLGCGDGSVSCDGETWEFQTAPDSLGASLRQLVKLYPDYTNESCGLHVHVSFRSFHDIGLLDTEAFYQYFYDKWTDWGNENQIHRTSPFWSRLAGRNHYCKRNRTVRGLDMDRYYALNFSAWHEHRTVECRMLPMFKSSRLSVSAVQWLIHIYDSWLNGRGATQLDEIAQVVVPVIPDQHQTVEHAFLAPTPELETLSGEVDTYTMPVPRDGYTAITRAQLIPHLAQIGAL